MAGLQALAVLTLLARTDSRGQASQAITACGLPDLVLSAIVGCPAELTQMVREWPKDKEKKEDAAQVERVVSSCPHPGWFCLALPLRVGGKTWLCMLSAVSMWSMGMTQSF